MPKLVEVKIDSLRVSLTNQQRIVVLKQVDADRYLPIWIGPYEAEAITIALQEIEVSRPQTHDLLNNMIVLLEGRLTQVTIHSLKDDIFFATLMIESGQKTLQVDSRPSDAIALAVRAHVSIFVDQKVMDEASIVPEEINEGEEEITSRKSETLKSEPGDSAKVSLNDERLSVFEEYFQARSKDQSEDREVDDQDDNEHPDNDQDQPDIKRK